MLSTQMMEINGLYAQINTPPALIGEIAHGLPPHAPRPSYAVDEYPACPKNWMHGSSKASSYFVPVTVGTGLWFDFTRNVFHTHDVAIVISVQGINPITGKKVIALNLEQYREKCPVHDIEFKQDRYCPKCEYIWPAQNYIASTTGQLLWIDGFRNEKGEVRQYILTEEIARGISAQVIGKDRVWAIGFAFYLSKEPRKTTPRSTPWFAPAGYQCMDSEYMDFDMAPKALYSMMLSPKASINAVSSSPSDSMSNSVSSSIARGSSMKRAAKPMEQKMLEIGAGARIKQEVGIDPNHIEFWQPEPIGLIYVSYVDEETSQKIISAGKRQDKKESSLAGLKVGN